METKILSLTFILLLSSIHFIQGYSQDKVLLRDVEAITLRSGYKTTGRRSRPIPQLTCVGGSAAGRFEPDVVQCYNRGWDGSEVQWECKATLPKKYRLGAVDVMCEGYGYPEDPYILKGSCGLEYRLEHASSSGSYNNNHYHRNNGGNWFGNLIMIGVLVFIFYTIYSRMAGTNNVNEQPRTGNSAPYNSGNRPDHSNPSSSPPPYGFRSEYCSGTSSGSSTHNTNQANRGNFWTGAATGGFLGYLFGSSRGHDRGYYGSNYYTPSSGYYGHTSSHHHYGGSSSSQGSHTSSGFGGTKRR